MSKPLFIIRQFENDDLEQVKVLIHKTIRFCYPLYYSYNVIEFFINLHNRQNILNNANEGYTLIALENEKIIATGCLNGLEIKAVYVDPRYQKMGVGKAIVNQLLVKARENGLVKIELDSTLNSKKFYDSMGFTTINKLSLPIKNSNLDYFRMEISLKA